MHVQQGCSANTNVIIVGHGCLRNRDAVATRTLSSWAIDAFAKGMQAMDAFTAWMHWQYGRYHLGSWMHVQHGDMQYAVVARALSPAMEGVGTSLQAEDRERDYDTEACGTHKSQGLSRVCCGRRRVSASATERSGCGQNLDPSTVNSLYAINYVHPTQLCKTNRKKNKKKKNGC